MQNWDSGGSQTLVSCAAARIHDPVLRLRFLRAAARLRERNRTAQRAAFFGAPVLLAAVCSPFLHLPARTAPTPSQPKPPAVVAVLQPAAPRTAPGEVWRVESNRESETYSNGLQVDVRYAVSNHPRAYLAFARSGGAAERRTEPAGIVFHTTESLQAPFEASQNHVLRQIGESLADYVRRRKSYNYLIDRFGRVHRIVEEMDAANHAGYSVWADESFEYVNLNSSFLGVSFEARTEPGQTEPTISPAQVRAASVLVEMLRSKYHIPEGNCVTHAQVSVNPDNMRAGYHTDWASSFPFAQIGLPDNYSLPLPAVARFGFECDPVFTHSTGARMAAGVAAATEAFAAGAASKGESPARFRASLQRLYRQRLHEVRRGTPDIESGE